MRECDLAFPDLLLSWYDGNARKMPWRVPPKSNKRADPYHVWLSEVMLQQTTVAAVESYFRKFVTLWPDVQTLASADDAAVMAQWAGLGYYARARNLLKCARALAAMDAFPETEAELCLLPGIGPYTAAAIAAIAFDQKATVVDGNVERVMARYFAETEPLPAVKPMLFQHAAKLTPKTRPGDYAQAVMDLGATICTPRNPACGICPVCGDCRARIKGIAAQLPNRLNKPEKPIRVGQVWIEAKPDGALVIQVRPKSGLLGGMLGLPTSGWDGSVSPAPKGNWQSIGEVRHTFTPFHLRLKVLRNEYRLNDADLDLTAFPTLFRKALLLALNLKA